MLLAHRICRFAAPLVLLGWLLAQSCVSSYRVDGISMMPAFSDGDRVVVARGTSPLANPRRGDTVILTWHGEVLIKRVMALPGEVVEMCNGQLLGNGKELRDPVPPDYRGSGHMAPLTLGEDEYFVLGDHRRVSVDSRAFGPVRRSDILGRVLLKVPR